MNTYKGREFLAVHFGEGNIRAKPNVPSLSSVATLRDIATRRCDERGVERKVGGEGWGQAPLPLREGKQDSLLP